MAGFVAMPLRFDDFLKKKINEIPSKNLPPDRITSRPDSPSLLLILLIVAQDDAHVGVPREVVVRRVHDGAVVRQTDVHLFELLAELGQRRGRLVLAGRADVTARRVRRSRIQRRHAAQVEQIRIVRVVHSNV